jgi:hypothetical protein
VEVLAYQTLRPPFFSLPTVSFHLVASIFKQNLAAVKAPKFHGTIWLVSWEGGASSKHIRHSSFILCYSTELL